MKSKLVTVGVVIYAGQKFAKITHHKIYAGDIYAILLFLLLLGATYVLKFISDFNYANFLSLA